MTYLVSCFMPLFHDEELSRNDYDDDGDSGGLFSSQSGGSEDSGSRGSDAPQSGSGGMDSGEAHSASEDARSGSDMDEDDGSPGTDSDGEGGAGEEEDEGSSDDDSDSEGDDDEEMDPETEAAMVGYLRDVRQRMETHGAAHRRPQRSDEGGGDSESEEEEEEQREDHVSASPSNSSSDDAGGSSGPDSDDDDDSYDERMDADEWVAAFQLQMQVLGRYWCQRVGLVDRLTFPIPFFVPFSNPSPLLFSLGIGRESCFYPLYSKTTLRSCGATLLSSPCSLTLTGDWPRQRQRQTLARRW